MTFSRIVSILVMSSIGIGFMGCSKANMVVPPAPRVAVLPKDPAKTPVFLVDNVVVNDLTITGIVPDDIQSITVLKPGPEHTLNELTGKYGPRASNGVLLIATKKGSKTRVNP